MFLNLTRIRASFFAGSHLNPNFKKIFKSGARVKIGYVAKATSDGIKVKDFMPPMGIPKRNIRYFSDSSSGSSGKYMS